MKNNKIYVYEIIKLTTNEKILEGTPYKLGLFLFDDTFNGFYHDMNVFVEEEWNMEYIFTEKFLFKLNNNIDTQEGKKEFDEKIKLRGIVKK